MRKLMLLLAVVLAVSGLAFAKKANLLNVEKGELPNDSSAVNINLSEENAFTKGGVCLKLDAATYPADFHAGDFQPKKGVWDGFDYLRFEYFNPGKTPMGLELVVKPEGAGGDYTLRFDQPLMFAPGKHAIEVELTGACSNNGAAIDWKKKIKQWYLAGKLIGPLYIGNFMLLGADDLEKLNGGGDEKPAKSDAKTEKKGK